MGKDAPDFLEANIMIARIGGTGRNIGRAGCVAVCIGACLAAPAWGDVVYTWWMDSQNFDYEIKHMPDLDQGRVPDPPNAWGLPNNGKQYCVPTSTMNMIMYIARHGHPQLAPGVKNWQNQSTYNEASVNILVLGMKMGTSGTSGTTGDGWLNGARAWFRDADYDHFVVNHIYAVHGWSPTHATITKAAIGGSLVAFAYGRYETVDEISGFPVVERRNGHIVTLAASSASSVTDSYDLWIRDPADGGTDTTQSTFTNRHLSVETHIVVTCAGGSSCVSRVMSALNYSPDNERTAYIDEYLTITPKSGYGFTNIGDLHFFKIFKPIQFAGSGGDEIVELPVDRPIMDAVSCPDQTCYGLLAMGGDLAPIPELRLLDAVTGESELLFEMRGATKLIMDPNMNMYVLAPREISKIERYGDEYDFGHSAVLPHEAQAMAFMDPPLSAPARSGLPGPNPDLVALSVTERQVMFYPGDLSEPSAVFAVPDSVQLGGEGAVAVPPAPEDTTAPIKVWMCSEASDDLFGVAFGPRGAEGTEVISLPAIQEPTGLDFDDAGHMFVSTINGLVELAKNAAGDWYVVEDSLFAGFDVGGSFRTVRSRSNFDPATMVGPGYYNIDPAELEFGDPVDDCPDPDDPIDSDRDGVSDWCDPCPYDNPDDSDEDGVCDSEDECPGFDNRACDDGNACTIDSCDPCINDAEGANGMDCVHDSGRLGICERGVCVQVCPDLPYDDISLLDHAAFINCMTGPASDLVDPGCDCYDYNGDNRVDLRDWALMAISFGGS